MADITMPQLGETVTEGTIIRWLKQVGDQVAHDEPLFEVSTDKVDSEVPSSAEGLLTEILAEEGATVDVGTRIAVVSDSADGAGPGGSTDEAAATADASASETSRPEPSSGEAPATAAAADETSRPEPPGGEAPATPARVARPEVAPPPAAAAEPDGVAVSEPPPAPVPDAGGGTEAASEAGPGLLLSPVVRKLLNENGIDPVQVTGTGAGGRITRNDVLSYIDSRAASGVNGTAAGTQAPPGSPARPDAAAPGGAPARAAAFAPASAGARDEVVPFTNIRRLTAEHMVRSKATSAHTLAAVEADYEGIERVRRVYKEQFREEEGFGLTYLPFVARAVVDVLHDFSNLNGSVGEDSLILHRDVNLGIAVDLDRQGLIVPVIRQADGQSLRGLARAMSDLAARARSRRLSADDVVGGTFTITNPGPFGTFITAPIINQPQVGILSTDGVKRRPVVVTAEDGSEAIAIHSVGMLALSFDHRAIDGAYASAFLSALRGEIETRDWSAEL